MKKILILLMLFIGSLTLNAQVNSNETIPELNQKSYNESKEITKFLGIPVDGYKSEMIQKLKEKGYKYNSTSECLEGEFNGREVEIHIVTNNNKVYRVAVFDKKYVNETDIKINFNNLVKQFDENINYWHFKDQIISKEDDISYEITCHNKRYQAVFYQEIKYPVSEINKDEAFENLLNKIVWFMIDEAYGRYRILLFYDNKYNEANGEDL